VTLVVYKNDDFALPQTLLRRPSRHTRQAKDLIVKLSLKSDTKNATLDFLLLNSKKRQNTHDFGIGIAIGGNTCYLGNKIMFGSKIETNNTYSTDIRKPRFNAEAQRTQRTAEKKNPCIKMNYQKI
jgi:hypothetical protein